MPRLRATTILAVRHNGKGAIGGDGQVTLGNVVMKSDAHKIRKLYDGKVLVGFAGASADAFALLDHITAAQVARLVLIPQDMRQNPLGAPRPAVPDRFGQLPAVLALGRAEQPLQIQTHLAPRLRTPEQLTHPPLQLRQRLTPPGQPGRLQHQSHPEPKPQTSTIKPCSP